MVYGLWKADLYIFFLYLALTLYKNVRDIGFFSVKFLKQEYKFKFYIKSRSNVVA